VEDGGSGEKTEKASPKRRREAREKGNVLKSNEVNTVISSIVMFAIMLIMSPMYLESLADILGTYLSPLSIISASREMTRDSLSGVYTSLLVRAGITLLPVIGTAMGVGAAVNLAQVGFLFTTKTMGMKLSRINPLEGFKRMFSVRSLVELLKAILKVGIIVFIVYDEFKTLILEIPSMMAMNIYTAFLATLKIAFRLGLKASAALSVIAAADFLFQWRKYEKDLMMTKQGVKEELKQTEGNPQIKGRIRSKQRQMSLGRMMQHVPSADVVITNPTHYAVALKYDKDKSAAPIVVAKGADFIAIKIKETAISAGVEIVEDKPLARALYSACDVGDEIPEEFYRAIADILAYIYKQKTGA